MDIHKGTRSPRLCITWNRHLRAGACVRQTFSPATTDTPHNRPKGRAEEHVHHHRVQAVPRRLSDDQINSCPVPRELDPSIYSQAGQRDLLSAHAVIRRSPAPPSIHPHTPNLSCSPWRHSWSKILSIASLISPSTSLHQYFGVPVSSPPATPLFSLLPSALSPAPILSGLLLHCFPWFVAPSSSLKLPR